MAEQDSPAPTVDIFRNVKLGRIKLELFVSAFEQDFTAGEARLRANPQLSQTILAHLASIVDKYDAIYTDLACLAAECDQSDKFPAELDQSQSRRLHSEYIHALSLCCAATAPGVNNTTANVVNQTDDGTFQFNQSRVRLPKVTLPTFSGVMAEWPSFRDRFMHMIDGDGSLPLVDKYFYLLGALSGDAAKVISHIPISGDHYAQAWQAIKKKYDDKRKLASSYVDVILHHSPLKPNPSLSSLSQLASTVADTVTSLKQLSIPDLSDYLLFELTLRLVDKETRQLYERLHLEDDFPSFESLRKFLQDRCTELERTEGSYSVSTSFSRSKPSKAQKPAPKVLRKSVLTTVGQSGTASPSSSNAAISRVFKCLFCSESTHNLFRCPKFSKLAPRKRRDWVAQHKLCFNCFSNCHMPPNCTSQFRCKNCRGMHNTLLHDTFVAPSDCKPTSARVEQPMVSQPISQANSFTQSATTLYNSCMSSTQVLLGTICLEILDVHGNSLPFRAILDPGSQTSLISRDAVDQLGLPIQNLNLKMFGAGASSLPNVQGAVSCELISRIAPHCKVAAKCAILKEITSSLPSISFSPRQFLDISHTDLADPQFWISKPVQLLIGADLFFSVLLPKPPKQIKAGCGILATIFGAVIIGKISSPPSGTSQCFLTSTPSLNDLMRRFWELEDDPQTITHPDDAKCEEHFLRTHSRTPSGRYMVQLPFRGDLPELPHSQRQALLRLKHLESRLERLPSLGESYREFMREYEILGHMSKTQEPSKYVIPHHAVCSQFGETQKLRVVFDSSMRTTSGSLNDHLLVGPKLQKDLSEVILNFRRFPYAFSADSIKMYRQILLDPIHRPYQHILWRESSTDVVSTYQLNTVTYGVSSSAYLSLRVLQQLIKDEGLPFPRASEALQHGLYVDDIAWGGQTLSEAKLVQAELVALLRKGGFELHKWKANSPELLTLSSDADNPDVSWDPSEYSKILGMVWSPSDDVFTFRIQVPNHSVSKRAVLSTIARIFDPLGMLGPVTLFARHIMQSLCSLKLSWDDSPPELIVHQWRQFLSDLPTLQNISVPRLILPAEFKVLDLLVFCDASETGYGAVAYLRSFRGDEIDVHLVKSMSRIAPLLRVTLPRLELCAAVLAVKLLISLKSLISQWVITDYHFFTDSTIVLSWLQIIPLRLKTFVSNRVSFILTHTHIDQWNHVSSGDNAADTLSRGCQPSELVFNRAWWTGPEWIHSRFDFESSLPLRHQPPELKPSAQVTLTLQETSFLSDFLSRFSSFHRLIRVTAYVRRFVHNSKASNDADKRLVGPLSCEELSQAETQCVKWSQRFKFCDEFDFSTNKPISSRLCALQAKCDPCGVLRVGGRLHRSSYSSDIKHPVILCKSMPISKLITRHLHLQYYHLTQSSLVSFIRRKFWMFGLNSVVRQVVRMCVTCRRLTVSPSHPLMGDLPPARTAQGRPFTAVGVDYAGPFMLKTSRRRNAPSEKCYVCIFICMSTKAVHIELVSQLTVVAFIDAFDRFSARRGLPSDIFSDNATNFVAASKWLKELYSFLNHPENQHQISDALALKQVSWHFNPPHAPNFGGLWEAAVKSMKYHLQRVIGNTPLVYEEFLTILTKVESILNSRPLCRAINDKADALTPGHFLIGAPLNALPIVKVSPKGISLPERWRLLQSAMQHFWQRWSLEYLHTLQSRAVWSRSTPNLQVGDVVVVRVSDATLGAFPLARVVEIHPGADSITRVVTIQTERGTYKRPASSLAPLLDSC